MRNYGEVLRALRKEAHVTQTQVAEALGLCTSTVCHFEKGLLSPTIDRLPDMAEALGVPVAYLAYRLFDEDPSNVSYGKLKKFEQYLDGLGDKERDAVLGMFDVMG